MLIDDQSQKGTEKAALFCCGVGSLGTQPAKQTLTIQQLQPFG